uniref:Predicted protein n=1 Tax=Hordeum vulgare subsp. vulgare TaxID=112509 RepID=F2DB24_HORVV|nr:predicted protein [Hordeum vulgare subsp. vulgare]
MPRRKSPPLARGPHVAASHRFICRSLMQPWPRAIPSSPSGCGGLRRRP